jgi:hypothetical protein
VDPEGVAMPVQLVPEGRAVKDKGVYCPTTQGQLEFSFSNVHSRFSKKVLHFRVVGGLSSRDASIRNLRPFSNPKGYEVDG